MGERGKEAGRVRGRERVGGRERERVRGGGVRVCACVCVCVYVCVCARARVRYFLYSMDRGEGGGGGVEYVEETGRRKRNPTILLIQIKTIGQLTLSRHFKGLSLRDCDSLLRDR